MVLSTLTGPGVHVTLSNVQLYSASLIPKGGLQGDHGGQNTTPPQRRQKGSPRDISQLLPPAQGFPLI